MVQLSHSYRTTGKNIALAIWTFVGKMLSLHFNTLFRLVIAFIPKGKHLSISWLQSPSAMIWEPPKIKSVTVSIVCPCIYHVVMEPDATIFFFLFRMLSFNPDFSLSSLTFIKRIFVSLLFLPLVYYHPHVWDFLFPPLQSWLQLVIYPA